MGERPRHQDKELEKVIREAEHRKRRVTKRPNAYYKMYCPCPEKHMKTVRLSPSDPNYARNLRAQLGRLACWEEDR